MTLTAVKVALDPTPAQQRALRSHAGASRFAYNVALAHVKRGLDEKEEVNWSFYGLRRWWNENKDALAVDSKGQTWWEENSKEAYSHGLECLAAGLKNWRESKTGKRKGRRACFPKFKSARGRLSFAYTTGSFGLISGDPKALKLPRIGRIHCFEDVARRVGDGKVTRMTVSYHGGRWYASLTVDREEEPTTNPTGGAVGIDLGVTHLATLSTGEVIENPRALYTAECRLRRAQRALSRTQKGSNRREKAKRRVGRLHARVAHVRQDTLNKMTTRLVQSYSHVVLEDLNVSGMVRNRGLAKAIHDASLAEIRRQVEYKCTRDGVHLTFVNRWFPSSKMCSGCGAVKAKLSLSERMYHCDNCGVTLDRDLNAAKNILVAGSAPETLKCTWSGRKTLDPMGQGQSTEKCEPSSHALSMV